ncbi:extensin, putative, partial [Ixodes scapularis]
VPVTKYPAVQQIPVPHHTHVYHHVPVTNGLPPVAHKVPVTQLHQAPATVHQLPLVHRLPPPKLVAPLIVHQVPRVKVPVHVFPYGPASVHHAPFAGYPAAAPSPVFLQKIPVAKFAAPAVPYVPIPKFSVPLTHPGHVAKPLGPGLVYSVPAPREALAPAFVQRPLVFKHAVPFLPSVKLTVPHLKAVPVQHFGPIGKVQLPVVFKKAPGRSRVPAYTPESVRQSAPSFDDDVGSRPINLGRGFQQKA